MTFLLARRSRSGPGNAPPRRLLSAPALAAAATAAVLLATLAGLAGAVLVVAALDPSGGLSGWPSVILSGRLLLLAQGGSLRLASGPLVLAPLLLTAGLAWALSRGARLAVRSAAGPDGDHPSGTHVGAVVGVVVGIVVAVQLALTAVVALLVDGPGARVGWLRTLAGTAVLGAAAAAWGAGRESGLLDAVLDRLPGPARPALRSVLAGAAATLGLCAAIVAIALAGDTTGYAAVSSSLGGAAAGALGLVGLQALLLPNAAAAVLGLAAGPGFAVGSATLVSVHGVRLGPVPALPMLAALPDTQAVPLLAFVSQAVPALAGLVAGGTLGRRLSADDGGSLVAGLWGLVVGAGMGLTSAALVAVAGGSLGSGGLAQVGAPVLATGLAVAPQAAVAAALAAVVARWRSYG